MSSIHFCSKPYSIFNYYVGFRGPSQSDRIPHSCKESSNDCSAPKAVILLDIGLNSRRLVILLPTALNLHLIYPLTLYQHLVANIHLVNSYPFHGSPFESDFSIFSVQSNMRVIIPLIDILVLLPFLFSVVLSIR